VDGRRRLPTNPTLITEALDPTAKGPEHLFILLQAATGIATAD
jgi:hypothetical protein